MAPPQWAYQVENYIIEPDEELICSICRSVFCDPVLCPCDHVFCNACITKWLQNNRNCPICRKRVYQSSIKQTVSIIKNLINKLMLNCQNKSLGCKAQFSVESSEAHVKECEYEFVQCKNIPCTDKLFRKNIIEHETKECQHRYTKCPNCKCKISSLTIVKEKHNCIKALQSLVKEKTETIQKQKDRIKELDGEIATLKARLQDTNPPRLLSPTNSLTSDSLSSISPDEITINIQDYDSESVSRSLSSSDSDMSSDSFYIFTNEIPFNDNNEMTDAFAAFMNNETNRDDSEFCNAESQTVNNRSPVLMNNEDSVSVIIDSREASEYRNAESQTVDLVDPLSLKYNVRNGNSIHENDSVTVEVPNSVFGEASGNRLQPRKLGKRRPTTEKPAKRRYLPPLISSDEDDEHTQTSSQSSKHCWDSTSVAAGDFTKANQRDTFNLSTEAGPSSASAPSRISKATTVPDNPKSKIRSLSKSKQKNVEQAKYDDQNNAASSGGASGNPIFERTLALLKQYNLESDPEWLPEYASHRGNDTTTESDSSLLESSNSDIDSDDKSIILDDSQHELPTISNFMNWMFDSSSEDDPDWRPESEYNS